MSSAGPRHFLYFPDEDLAHAAAREAEEDGFLIDVGQLGEEWRFIATNPALEIPDARARLEAIALRHNGEYDGWEATPATESPNRGRGLH